MFKGKRGKYVPIITLAALILAGCDNNQKIQGEAVSDGYNAIACSYLNEKAYDGYLNGLEVEKVVARIKNELELEYKIDAYEILNAAVLDECDRLRTTLQMVYDTYGG